MALNTQSGNDWDNAPNFDDYADNLKAADGQALERYMAKAVQMITGRPATEVLAPINADALPPSVARAYGAFQAELKAQAETLARSLMAGENPSYVNARLIVRGKLYDGGAPLPIVPEYKQYQQVAQHPNIGLGSAGTVPVGAVGVAEGVYLDRINQQLYFTGGRTTSSGQLIASSVARFETGPNNTLILNGRVLYGVDDLKEIAGKVNAAFEEAGGLATGTRRADKALSSSLLSRPNFGTSDHTAAYEAKLTHQVPPPPKAHKYETAQELYQRMRTIMPDDPVFFRGEDKLGYKALPTLAAVGGFFVEGQGYGANVYLSGREGKAIKDSQKALRDYLLTVEGRQFQGAIRMAGAARAEQYTGFNTFWTNLDEVTHLSKDAARGMTGSTPVRRVVAISDSNFTPYHSDKVEYVPGRGLKYGEVNGVPQYITDINRNWDGMSGFTTRTFTRNGQKYLEINASGEVDLLKRTTKAWGANKSLVTATSLYGLEGSGYEAISPIGANKRQNLHLIVDSVYGGRRTGASDLQSDLIDVIGRDEEAQRQLMHKYGLTTKADLLQRLSDEIEIHGGATSASFVWGRSKMVDSALWFLGKHLIEGDSKHTRLLKTEELSMPMTHAGYNRLRLGLGEWDPENANAEGVMLTDRSLWQDESGQFDPNKRVDVKVRMRGLAMERMGYQIAQAWDTGHGRMSFEEISGFLKNTAGYSDAYADAIIKKAMPRLWSAGARNRKVAEDLLRANMLNSQMGFSPEELGVETIGIEEFQEKLSDWAAANKVSVRDGIFRALKDASFLGNGIKGKFINANGYYIAPADVVGLLGNFAKGDEPSEYQGGKESLYVNGRPQAVRALQDTMNSFARLMQEATGSAKWDKRLEDLAKRQDKLSSARGVMRRATSSAVGAEKMYEMNPNIPANTLVLGTTTAMKLFGTNDPDKIRDAIHSGRGLVAGLLRRPTSMNAMSRPSLLNVKLFSDFPEEYPAEKEGMVISSDLGDPTQGDSDGDRAITWAMSMLKNGAGITDARLSRATSQGEFLKMLGRGFSQMSGRPINFKSIEEYQSYTYDLYKAFKGSEDAFKAAGAQYYGVGISEVGKSIGNLAERYTTSESIIGSYDEHETASPIESIMRKVMMGEGIGQKEMQLAYNVYQRSMAAAAHLLGDVDRGHTGRLGYYTYQRAVDKQVFDPGTRMLIALKQQYTIGKNYVTDSLDPDLAGKGTPDTMSFTGSGPMSLMNTIIKSTVSSHMLRGGGYNANWLHDIGRSLSGNNAGIGTIMNILRADDVVGPLLSQWEQSDEKGRINLDLKLQQAVDERAGKIASSIAKLAFGNSSSRFATAGGTQSSMIYGAIMERAARFGSSDPEYIAFASANPEEAEKLTEIGKLMNAYIGVSGGRNQDAKGNDHTMEHIAQVSASGIVPDPRGKKSPVLTGLLGQIARQFRKYDTPLKNERAYRPGIISDEEHKLLVEREQTANDKEFAKIFAAKNGLLVVEPRAYGNASKADRAKAVMKLLEDAGLNPSRMFGNVTYGDAVAGLSGFNSFGLTIEQARAENEPLGGVSQELSDLVSKRIAMTLMAMTGGDDEIPAIIDDLKAANDPFSALSAKWNAIGSRTSAGSGGAGAPPPPGGGPSPAQRHAGGRRNHGGSYRTFMQSFERLYGQKATTQLFDQLANDPSFDMNHLAFLMASEKPDGDAPDYGPRLGNVKKALDKGNVEAIMREFPYIDRAGGDTAQGMKAGLLKATMGKADQLEFDKVVDRLTTKFDKLGGSLDVVTKNIGSFSEVIQRASETSKPLTQEEALRQKAAYGMLEPLRQARDKFGGDVFESALSRQGIGQDTVTSLNETLNKYEGVRLQELESLIKGEGHGTAQGGIRGVANKLFEGDLGQLGWGLFNVQRIWRMTGGQVQANMSDYANYSAQQQQAIMALGGTQGYTGPVADVIGQTNAVKRFGLAMGKAGWDLFGWIPQMIGGSGFIDPDKPSGAMYMANAGMTIGGAAVGTRLLGNLASNMGMKDVGGTLGGIGGFIGTKVLPAAMLGLGIEEIGRSIGQANNNPYADDPGRFMKSGIANALALPLSILTEIEANFGDKENALKNVQAYKNIYAGLGLSTEKTKEQLQYERYQQWGKDLEANVGTLDAGGGLQVAKLIAKTSGISDGTLTGSSQVKYLAEQIARQGLGEETVGKVQFGMQLGHAAGYQYGSAGMASYTSRYAMNLMPDQMMQAQSAFQNIGSFVGLAQQTGVNLPWLNPQMLAGMDKGSQWTLSQLGGGNQLQWSRLGQLGLLTGQGARGDQLDREGLSDYRKFAKIANSDDARRAITVESTGLPVMSTDESVTVPYYDPVSGQMRRTRGANYYSREDYDKALAKSGFNLGGRFNYAPQFGQLRSLADLTNDRRNTQREYQDYQYQSNLQSYWRDYEYTFGNAEKGITGSYNWQRASLGESMRHTQAMAALQAGTLGGQNGYGWFNNALQGVPLGTGVTRGSVFIPQIDASKFTYQQAGALQGYDIKQLGQAGLQYRQFYEQMANQRTGIDYQREWAREDAWRTYDRGMTQLGWSKEDTQTSFNRSLIQFSQAVQDLTTNFQRNQTTTQWSREQLSFQGNKMALNFGWQMEDLEEAYRYSTGRDRRKIARQMERGTIEYGMGVSQLETEKKHLEQRAKWLEEDFAKEQARIEQRRKWSEADFAKDLARFGVREQWLKEDLERTLDRIQKQADLEDESWKLKIKHFEEDAQMQKLLHEEGVKNALTMAGIQAGQLEENYKREKEAMEQRLKDLEKQHETELKLDRLMDSIEASTTVAEGKVRDFAYDLGDPNGAMTRAMSQFVLNWNSKMNDPSNSIYAALVKLVNNFKIYAENQFTY